jgi:hypothetical protein
LLGNLAGNILSGLAGAAVGGTSGAAGAANVNLYNQGKNAQESEAQKEVKDIRQQLDQEKANLGQAGAKVPDGAQAATLPSSALAAGIAGKDGPTATGTGLSNILMPDGKPVGYVYPGAGPGIRTVSSGQFDQLQSQLMNGATPVTTPSGYAGTRYKTPDGSVFGIRTSAGSGTTIDVIKSNSPTLPPGFKVHQQ